ncbi:MAG TPA: 30S ribosomal protein S6 [Thermoanaerobaculia bacterium]|nr:30S ribosomal protein S6 [Thermoanaerobaculia bacterium]
MGTYEVLFIISPRLPDEEVTSLINEFRAVGEDNGLKLSSEDPWGRRKLAYPIQKLSDGIYHLFVFEGEGTGLSEIDRRMKNSDKIVRHMIVRTDLETRRARKIAARNAKKKPKAAPEPVAPGVTESAPAEAAAE